MKHYFLEHRTKEELKAMAAKLGLKHEKENREKLIKRLENKPYKLLVRTLKQEQHV